ncbi:DMT family transporter [Accumulibacter sp.]|uniref:DMT family transporter n=1 Tax=Accumulibacter sp. TaxID=2053492 RepID=UPI0028C4E630|nr:DMT family transporter [Accumulibacter sp.]
MNSETRGMWLGLLGVAAFSLTLPATRAAVASLSPIFVGMGRVVVAALPAAIYLLISRRGWPTRAQLKSLIVVALGIAFGFPVLSALAMREVEASHAGIMLGVLPLATAAAGALLTGERPSAGFWGMAVLGTLLVVAFSLSKGAGTISWADLALLAAVGSAAIGYAEGARLARSLGGVQVISWAVVIAAPFLVIPASLFLPGSVEVSLGAWLAFLYVSLVSQFLGFIPWYRGLALGGIARVGQTQLLQPFFTLVAAAVLLGESVDTMTLVFAVLVCLTVAVGRSMRVGTA